MNQRINLEERKLFLSRNYSVLQTDTQEDQDATEEAVQNIARATIAAWQNASSVRNRSQAAIPHASAPATITVGSA